MNTKYTADQLDLDTPLDRSKDRRPDTNLARDLAAHVANVAALRAEMFGSPAPVQLQQVAA